MWTKPKLSTLFICFSLLIVFLLFGFPFQNLRGYIFEKIYAQTRITITADEIYPALFGWPGIGMKNVDVTLPVGTRTLDLSCKKLVFKVGLAGLFPPSPSISLYLKNLKQGGDLFIKVGQGKTRIDSDVEANDIVLDQLALSGLTETLTGSLNLTAELALQTVDLAKSTGEIDIGIEKLKIPAQNFQGFFVLPAMNLASLKSKINIRNGIAEISSFNFGDKGSDLQGSLSGEVRLGKEVMQSLLNVTLRLELSESYRTHPQAESLLSLLNSFQTSPGRYAMKWSSSFQDMSANFVNAIPQKVEY